MSRSRHQYLYPLVALLPLLICTVLIVNALFQWFIKPNLNAQRALQEKHFDAFKGDLEYLIRIDLFTPPRNLKHDASEHLNSRVFWSPTSDGLDDGYEQTPRVPKAVKETLIRFRDDWIQKYERAKHMVIDLSVFSEILRFDYWDIEKNSPISRLVESHRFIPPPQLPIPDASDLLALVKIRLMNGALDQNFFNALNEVRHLAKLLLSTENMQLMISGLAILNYERQAHRFYVERLGMPMNVWQPVSQNVTRRAHRAILATRAYLHIWTATYQLDEIFLGTNPPIGFCAAVNEAFPLEFALRPLLKPHWPVEIDLSDEYVKLEQIYRVASNQCRLRYLKSLVERDAIRVRVPGPFMLVELPYIRKVFGMRSSIAAFQGLESYSMTSF